MTVLIKARSHDGAYKGQVHVFVPFIGRKNGNLIARLKLYNDVHCWYRAHIEHLHVLCICREGLRFTLAYLGRFSRAG